MMSVTSFILPVILVSFFRFFEHATINRTRLWFPVSGCLSTATNWLLTAPFLIQNHRRRHKRLFSERRFTMFRYGVRRFATSALRMVEPREPSQHCVAVSKAQGIARGLTEGKYELDYVQI
jgi:hypothetical protein